MHIDINDPAIEARMEKQIKASGGVEEALKRLLQTQEEQDRWLFENRDPINAKIGRGMAQLDRGEGIPEDDLDAYLDEVKAQPE
jgi:post-segregation antitoxin (ccd killing protein)